MGKRLDSKENLRLGKLWTSLEAPDYGRADVVRKSSGRRHMDMDALQEAVDKPTLASAFRRRLGGHSDSKDELRVKATSILSVLVREQGVS